MVPSWRLSALGIKAALRCVRRTGYWILSILQSDHWSIHPETGRSDCGTGDTFRRSPSLHLGVAFLRCGWSPVGIRFSADGCRRHPLYHDDQRSSSLAICDCAQLYSDLAFWMPRRGWIDVHRALQFDYSLLLLEATERRPLERVCSVRDFVD
jgi:hypothetical protein